MSSKVRAEVAWGVEMLFGADGHVPEAVWDAMTVLEQQTHVRNATLGVGQVAAISTADDDEGEVEVTEEAEVVTASRKGKSK